MAPTVVVDVGGGAVRPAQQADVAARAVEKIVGAEPGTFVRLVVRTEFGLKCGTEWFGACVATPIADAIKNSKAQEVHVEVVPTGLTLANPRLAVFLVAIAGADARVTRLVVEGAIDGRLIGDFVAHAASPNLRLKLNWFCALSAAEVLKSSPKIKGLVVMGSGEGTCLELLDGGIPPDLDDLGLDMSGCNEAAARALARRIADPGSKITKLTVRGGLKYVLSALSASVDGLAKLEEFSAPPGSTEDLIGGGELLAPAIAASRNLRVLRLPFMVQPSAEETRANNKTMMRATLDHPSLRTLGFYRAFELMPLAAAFVERSRFPDAAYEWDDRGAFDAARVRQTANNAMMAFVSAFVAPRGDRDHNPPSYEFVLRDGDTSIAHRVMGFMVERDGDGDGDAE